MLGLKKIGASAPLLLLLLCWASPTLGQDRVLLLPGESGEPPTGLSHALRIQLSGIVEVVVYPVPLSGAGLGPRVQAAGAIAEREGALLVAWTDPAVEQPDGSQQVVIYAVGRREGRAVLEVVRVPGGSGPDVDRALALKLHDVIDALVAAHEQGRETLLEPTTGAPKPIHLLGLVGLSVVGLEGSTLGQWAGRGATGLEFSRASLHIRGIGGLALAPSLEVERAGQRVRLSEVDPFVALAASLDLGPVSLGLGAELSLSFLRAEGITLDGERGGQTLRLLTLRPELLCELPITGRFAAVLTLGVELRPSRQRLQVAGETVVQLGRLRPAAGLALLLR